MNVTIPVPRSVSTAHDEADTSYTNSLQFSSEWQNAIVTIWMYHAESKTGGGGYYLPNLNLLKDGPDLPVPGETITSYKGVRDYWSIAFMDAGNNLWCTESGFHLDIPNQNGPNDIEVVFSQNTVVITMQDGKPGKPIPLVWYG